ncbi:MAG: DUF177 domain-containing protein [Rhizobiaceae bacterium]|jgi:uncharacterized metal-binding protein YceD (DUF177 family)|nr:DUF177 domain-containing protein [Rhizobiaceae bacterium]
MSAPTLLVRPARLTKKGEHFTGALDQAACAAVAAELGILAVHALNWTLHARQWRKDGFALTGHVEAVVEQACIVTTDPVRQHIREEIDLRFLPEVKANRPKRAGDAGDAEDLAFDASPEDEPECFAGDTFDAGPLVIEHMALGLDPYPRAPGATFDEAAVAALQPEDESPMARALRQWGKKSD